MYFHAGQDFVLNTRDLLGVFDLDTAGGVLPHRGILPQSRGGGRRGGPVSPRHAAPELSFDGFPRRNGLPEPALPRGAEKAHRQGGVVGGHPGSVHAAPTTHTPHGNPGKVPRQGQDPALRPTSGHGRARPRRRAGFWIGSPGELTRWPRAVRLLEHGPLREAKTISGDLRRAPGFLKGPAGPLSRAPRLGTSGGFFGSFLAGQKGTYRNLPGNANL